MIVIKWLFLSLVGLSSGFAVAAGVFAFITMLGVVPRLTARTKTEKHLICYERMIILGGTLGNIWMLFSVKVPGTIVLLAFFGLGAGVFVGCLAMALAEMLRIIPIFSNRLQLKEGFPILIVSLAVGKFLGVLYQYFIL